MGTQVVPKKPEPLIERIPSRAPVIVALLIAAMAVTTAVQPLAAIGAAGVVILAWDIGRRR